MSQRETSRSDGRKSKLVSRSIYTGGVSWRILLHVTRVRGVGVGVCEAQVLFLIYSYSDLVICAIS